MRVVWGVHGESWYVMVQWVPGPLAEMAKCAKL